MATVSLALPLALAQDKPKDKPTDKPAAKTDDKKPAAKADEKGAGGDQADMMEMILKLAEPGENHKLLHINVGDWTYTMKHYMDPEKPNVSTGTASYTSAKGGRFVIGEHKGKMEMPGADGKMSTMMFEGMGINGYDNVKKHFTGVWFDNMGTMMITSVGTYDAATKTFTYTGEWEMAPGMKSSFKQTIKIVDNDHQHMEWWESMGGSEMAKMMEIDFTRKK